MRFTFETCLRDDEAEMSSGLIHSCIYKHLPDERRERMDTVRPGQQRSTLSLLGRHSFTREKTTTHSLEKFLFLICPVLVALKVLGTCSVHTSV